MGAVFGENILEICWNRAGRWWRAVVSFDVTFTRAPTFQPLHQLHPISALWGQIERTKNLYAVRALTSKPTFWKPQGFDVRFAVRRLARRCGVSGRGGLEFGLLMHSWE